MSLVQLARTRLGTVAELSRRSGVSVSSIWRIENETRPNPKADTLHALAAALDMKPEALLEVLRGRQGPEGAANAADAA